MREVRLLVLFMAGLSALFADTFGSVVSIIGGASDLVLDEARSRLYLVTETANQVAVYSTTNRRFLTPVNVDLQPIAAAISRDGRYLYVTSYGQASLDVIDLNTTTVAKRISLPAKPEGVAVGGDGRVLISTIGTGAGNSQNILLIYDPNNTSTNNVTNVVITPAAPTPPVLPAPSGRIYDASRSQLAATPDGKYIIGVNNPSTTTRLAFVYESASGTVLRSRNVGSLSTVLSVSPDGSRFMAGLSLFDTASLTVLGQQNTANSLYPYPNGANFNLQQNQGGSVFAPDSSAIYAAFNIVPVQNPPARANVSQMLVSDPDNLFIKLGLQLAENLVGKMAISSDGSTIYALSDSGFMILSMSAVMQAPIAMPSNVSVLLGNDQCGVTAGIHSVTVPVQNLGTGNLTASATLLQPGGGIATTTVNIPGFGAIVLPGLLTPNQPTTQASYTNSAPSVRTVQTASGPAFQFTYNSAAGTSLGTPQAYDFLIQSPQAINIPPRVHIFQNNRNAEALGNIIPVDVGVNTSDGLVDMIVDSQRQRLYIANEGLNRVEVFDTRQQQFLTPIKVGQLPISLALSLDGSRLYVAAAGGENIGIVDPDKGQVIGRVNFPPIPLNAAVGIVTPSVIAMGLSGLQIVMSDGTLWQVINGTAVPRKASTAIGTQTNGLPLTISAPRQMAATPNGEYIILLAGTGYVYLYDATADDFVIGRQIFTAPIQGYYGPIAAGPRGTYYLVNGTVLNSSVTPVASAPSVTTSTSVRGGTTTSTITQPVSAVAVATTSTFLRLSPPVATSATAVLTAPPTVEVVDVNTALAVSSMQALEGPATTQVGTARANIAGRTMAISPSGSTAYALTTSGLSIVPLPTATTGPGGGGLGGGGSQTRISQNGVVNVANYKTGLTAGSIAAIFGSNLATQGLAGSWPLPTILGGVCITLNNNPMSLLFTSPQQVNVQLPVNLSAGRYSMIIRQPGQGVASSAYSLTVSKVSPVVFSDPATGQAWVYDSKGRMISKSNPITRDQNFTMYATGLGATKGVTLVTGQPTPMSPLAVTANPVRVFFGTPTWTQAEMIVNWAGLAPGFIGLYQINGTVPGDRIHGDGLPVSIEVGGASSVSTGTGVPFTSID